MLAAALLRAEQELRAGIDEPILEVPKSTPFMRFIQLLAPLELFSAKTQALVKVAAAELKALKIEFENAKNLLNKNIVSQTELDLAAAKADASKPRSSQLTVSTCSASAQVSTSA